jgi:hypothetical protein
MIISTGGGVGGDCNVQLDLGAGAVFGGSDGDGKTCPRPRPTPFAMPTE